MASFKNVERRSVWPDVAAKVLSQFCANKKRLLYCFPANATHILQPCDTAIFKPLKMLGGKKCDFTSNEQTTTNVQNSPVHDESTMIYSNENDLDVGLTDLDLLNIEEMPIEIDGNIIDLGVNTVVEDDNNIDLGLFTTFASNEVDTLPNITAIKVQGNDQIGSIAQSPKPGNDKLEYVEQSDDSPNQHIEVADVICKSKEDDKSKEDEYVSCTIELLTERPHEQSINSDDHT
ncbi:hypothetical protein J6590_102332 [Homalodisca vitripennis]|nr:hypothetical protein J6590_102332 [Homalodisca vitripennis]